jgi:hypothetical protein
MLQHVIRLKVLTEGKTDVAADDIASLASILFKDLDQMKHAINGMTPGRKTAAP